MMAVPAKTPVSPEFQDMISVFLMRFVDPIYHDRTEAFVKSLILAENRQCASECRLVVVELMRKNKDADCKYGEELEKRAETADECNRRITSRYQEIA